MGLATVQRPWPSVLDVGGVISFQVYPGRRALIYATHEPFFKPHIWSIPDAWADEHVPP